MNIYLIGMPGVGKTTLGKELANELNYNFIDTDELIKTKTNSSINDLFQNEKDFRKIESEVINNIKGETNCVISLGGGAVLNKDNVNNLYGLIIYLYTDLVTLKSRLDISTRPLFKKISLEKLYNDRIDLYENCSDYKIDNINIGDSIKQIVKIINKPKKNVLVINGPNLNMLGKRDEKQYGNLSLQEINDLMKSYDIFEYNFFQSNIEGEIINKIHELDNYDYLIINPAAYTHTSIAIKDALDIFNIPKIEVHLSDVNSREEYRKINYISEVCTTNFVGKREFSYLDAINYLKKLNL
ncbi:MAG: type II 3-dehydroquinate dehydratase [bacterium]